MASLLEFFEKKYAPIRLYGGRPKTKESYRRTIRRFSETLGREACVEDLQDDEVAMHLARLEEEGKLARATIVREQILLKALNKFAFSRHVIHTLLSLPALRTPEKAPEAWNEGQMRLLFASCIQEVGVYGGVPASYWWRAFILVMFDTAERVSALRQCKWSWLKKKHLVIPAAARKNKIRDKPYELGRDALRALDAIRRPERELIWPWDMAEATLYNHYTRILKRAGLSHRRSDKFHRIRKTVATHMVKNGHDPRLLLDHANESTTRKYIDRTIAGDGIPPCNVLFRLGGE